MNPLNLKTISLLRIFVSWPSAHGQTVVGIHGSQFTIDNNPTYSTISGFPSSDPNLRGTLVNARAGLHILRIIAHDQRSPRITEICSILEIPFSIER